MDKFYDMIACDYDELVQNDVCEKRFPYASYNEIQDILISYIYDNKHLSKAKILDIGIGTGSLYEKILPDKYELIGIDISKKMLEVAKLKFPEANLLEHNMEYGLPEDIKDIKFDYIIINYFVNHFDSQYVINLINQLSKYLSPFGKIFISDVMFLDEAKKILYLKKNPKNTLPKYFYHTYSEIIKHTSDLLALSFMEVDEYSGILIIEKYYESSLHFEDSLIKYKTNTLKWKSSQSQKKRE